MSFWTKDASKISGQGATEYLVILSVVLIIALVSVSLLGNSLPGVSDAKNSEGAIYWQSAKPIAIIGSSADGNGVTFRLRNNGPDAIDITGIVSSGSTLALAPPISLAAGEEYLLANVSGLNMTGRKTSVTISSLGFTYNVHVGGASLSKTQPTSGNGGGLVVGCTSDCSGLGSETGCGSGCGYGFGCCQISGEDYACVGPIQGPQMTCNGLDICPAGQFNCGPIGCLPIGSVCNNCNGACGSGRVCCVCDGQCTDEGACACEHCEHVQCVGGNCLCDLPWA